MTVSLVKDDNKIVLTNSLPKFFKQFIVKQHKFKCAWTKKNGDFRVGNFDLRFRKRYKTAEGVWKKNKGKRRLGEDALDTYCVAFDLDKKDYRMINYNTIEYIEVGRAKFSVEVSTDDMGRVFEMKSLDTIKSN